MNDRDDIMTAHDVAEWLQVSLVTVRRWTSSCYIPHVKVGRIVRFQKGVIDNWLAKRSSNGRTRRVPEVTLPVFR